MQKDLEQIKQYAENVAKSFFYSDVDEYVLWKPFEDYDSEWVAHQIEILSFEIRNAMLWAQDKKVK